MGATQIPGNRQVILCRFERNRREHAGAARGVFGISGNDGTTLQSSSDVPSSVRTHRALFAPALRRAGYSKCLYFAGFLDRSCPQILSCVSQNGPRSPSTGDELRLPIGDGEQLYYF